MQQNDNYGKIKGKKQRKLKLQIKQRRLRAITLQEAIEKSTILPLQYWKISNLIAP